MSGLLENNPSPKIEKVVQQPIVKKRRSYKKMAGLLACMIVFVSGGRYAIDSYKEHSATKKAEAKINALMQKQKEEESARIERVANNKVAYLTFDDGPNFNTEKILDILKENEIKATFFLVGNMIENNIETVRRIYEEGHTIANHTYSHNYSYKTKEDFIKEVQDTDDLISQAIGKTYKSYFVRVPGGSMGKKIPQEAIKENGYKSINWTALFGDDEKGGKVNKDYVVNRVKETAGNDKYEVILAHGTKSVTADSLQSVIDNLKESGYIFERLMEDSPVEFN